MTTLPVTPAPPSWCDNDFLLEALTFAAHAHETQVRKYTGEPYIYHPIDVATRLHDALNGGATDEMLAAALLHDVVEDCEVTFTEVRRRFGDITAHLVMCLTDLVTKEQGNRETRKFMEAMRISHAPISAQVIKICDMMSNTASIVAHDPDFARVYLREKERALSAIFVAWTTYDSPALRCKEVVELYNAAVQSMEDGIRSINPED